MTPNSKRNSAILKYLADNDESFELVARHFGVTRNTVAGIVFRHRHPPITRIGSRSKPTARNMMGHGWQPPTYRPEKTATTNQER